MCSTRPASISTLFRSISNGMDWATAADSLARIDPLWAQLFNFYIAFISFAVLNATRTGPVYLFCCVQFRLSKDSMFLSLAWSAYYFLFPFLQWLAEMLCPSGCLCWRYMYIYTLFVFGFVCMYISIYMNDACPFGGCWHESKTM